jgi:hypothetical protein
LGSFASYIEKIYHHTNSPILSTPYRTDRELFWIKELGTAMPYVAMITSKEWESHDPVD